MKKVLIISYYFPPVNAIASRRYGDMAPFMPLFGWEPFIVTTHSEGNLATTFPEKNVIRVGENCDSGKTLVSEEKYRGISPLLKPFYSLYRNAGIELKSADRFFLSWGKDVLSLADTFKKIKPDAIVATYLPAVDIWLGNRLSKKLAVPWVADFRDASSLSSTARLALAKWADKKIDYHLVKSAAAIVTISPMLASYLEAFYKKPADVIYNGFNADEPLLRTPQKTMEKNRTLYYAGRFHPHRIAAVKLLIDWLGEHKKERVSFTARSLGPKEANDEILAYAKTKRVSPLVNILPPSSPDVILREEREASALMVFEDIKKDYPLSNVHMTGKLFEYLPFEAPIIAITREDSDIRRVLDDTRRGYVVATIDKLSDIMQYILQGKDSLPQRERILSYSRKAQCEKLCQILDRVTVLL